MTTLPGPSQAGPSVDAEAETSARTDVAPDAAATPTPTSESSAVGELVVRDARWRRGPAPAHRIALLYFDRPVFEESGEVSLHVRIEDVDSPWRRSSLFLRMAFDDLRVRTLDAYGTVTNAREGVSVLISGLGTPGVGWYAQGQDSETGSWELAVRVSLALPEDVRELVGTLMAEAPVIRTGLPPARRAHARMSTLEEFAVPIPLPARRQAPAHLNTPNTDNGLAAQPTLAQPASSSVRLCVAVDIERYSRFRTPEAVRAQERLVEILARACRHAGIADDQAETQVTGDGRFVVFAPGLDESAVIPALVQGLEVVLSEVNNDLNDRARLRLRVALHRGHLTRGSNGWAGVSSIAVHRLLDSGPARRALDDRPQADFTLIVPDSLYSDVIAHGYGLLRPDRFAQVDVDVPAKGFSERAWVYVPGDA
ncbi:MAG TPA: hypothetical protein VGX23_32570 [Actinocrinis sp.]|nr:hypothetical protein [Actinocrinis sp.]